MAELMPKVVQASRFRALKKNIARHHCFKCKGKGVIQREVRAHITVDEFSTEVYDVTEETCECQFPDPQASTLVAHWSQPLEEYTGPW